MRRRPAKRRLPKEVLAAGEAAAIAAGYSPKSAADCLKATTDSPDCRGNRAAAAGKGRGIK